MYGVEIAYPVDRRAEEQFLRSTRAAAAQGAVLVVSLVPDQSLRSLTKADARRANTLFEQAHRQYDTQLLVRFAPQMNGTWVRWGQQPTQFVQAFRTVARQVHTGGLGRPHGLVALVRRRLPVRFVGRSPGGPVGDGHREARHERRRPDHRGRRPLRAVLARGVVRRLGRPVHVLLRQGQGH
ncbi:hypothetical protein [Curtobacterium sp. MCPF17_052]|uniref:hypothetical protein n=1 Tax=Curtobacterium sp. MCPF17_052 TaxID=2175655 RepID=UPI0024E02166|nr:hypothetical protein [Curtobacterium sp. MCPF17_052]WIB11964.1 hypothetical protein DEJ36_14055 [Curtobacterium sp. MCPF17_052]